MCLIYADSQAWMDLNSAGWSTVAFQLDVHQTAYNAGSDSNGYKEPKSFPTAQKSHFVSKETHLFKESTGKFRKKGLFCFSGCSLTGRACCCCREFLYPDLFRSNTLWIQPNNTRDFWDLGSQPSGHSCYSSSHKFHHSWEAGIAKNVSL